MADINSSLPIRTQTDGDVVVKLTDGTDVATIRDVTGAKALDVALVNGSGAQITNFGGSSHTDDAAFTPATDDITVAGGVFDDTTPDSVDEGDAGALRMSGRRELYTQLRDAAGNERGANVDASNRLTVLADLGATDNAVLDNIDADTSTIATNTTDLPNVIGTDGAAGPSKAVSVGGTDGSGNLQEILVDTSGRLAIGDISAGTQTNDVKITLDSEAVVLGAGAASIGTLGANSGTDIGDVTINNTEATAIPVYITGAVSGGEVVDYDTSAAISAAATDNHDYTITGGKTLLLKEIIVSSSGKMKVAVSAGPVASLVTKTVIFTTSANPTYTIKFDQPIEIPSTSTGTVRVARTNLEGSAMDVYSTIIGVEQTT